MTHRRRQTTLAAAAATTAIVLAGTLLTTQAAATPPSDPAPAPTNAVSGVLDDTGRRPFKAKQDGVQLRTRERTTVTSFDLVYPPRSFSGWHTHPGIVIAVVREGYVLRSTGCRTERFDVGESFTEVGAHHVSNPAGTRAVLAITRVYPSDMTTGRFEAEPPDCS